MNELQRLTNPRAQVRGDDAMIKERLTGAAGARIA